jgi:hypothetical protein
MVPVRDVECEGHSASPFDSLDQRRAMVMSTILDLLGNHGHRLRPIHHNTRMGTLHALVHVERANVETWRSRAEELEKEVEALRLLLTQRRDLGGRSEGAEMKDNDIVASRELNASLEASNKRLEERLEELTPRALRAPGLSKENKRLKTQMGELQTM